MADLQLQFEPEKFTVKQINARIRRALKENFSNLYVTGEVSALKSAASGHLYFNLKEEDSVLPCVMYRQSARLMKLSMRDGLMVQARGYVDVYEPRGMYQFLVEHVEPLGIGALQQAFEALKRKLQAEGLFEGARKRALPKYPRRIGIVTSPTGAVIQDMLQIFARRWPGLEIRLYPVLVQGAGSADQICEGIRYFSEGEWAEVLIVGRGGGSLEDLWSFNEERVARAIAACSIPVVSAVGHETDVTIADFVADLRAPTPSAAAELVVPLLGAILEGLDAEERRMRRAMVHQITSLRERLYRQGIDRAQVLLQRRIYGLQQRIDDAEETMAEGLRERLREAGRRLQGLETRLIRKDLRHYFAALEQRLERQRGRLLQAMGPKFLPLQLRLERSEGRLREMDPLRILARGYAVVTTQEGVSVKHPEQAPVGTRLGVRVAEGSFEVVSGGQ